VLRSVRKLRGYRVHATDVEFGKVDDLLFDDVLWTIRYLVVDTDGWLPGRKVLIPAKALGRPKWEDHVFPVTLTREQIEQSPNISQHEPVSRQHERDLHAHFGLQPYWMAGYPGGAYPTPAIMRDRPAIDEYWESFDVYRPSGDPYLRSVWEIFDYRIHAEDHDIGHAFDFLVEDEAWVLRYLIVDTGSWLPGRKVLVALSWVKEVSWADSKVYVDVTRDMIEHSPKYDHSQPVNRKEEEVLFDYYGRPRYWREKENSG
jgi:hypothetical protein